MYFCWSAYNEIQFFVSEMFDTNPEIRQVLERVGITVAENGDRFQVQCNESFVLNLLKAKRLVLKK